MKNMTIGKRITGGFAIILLLFGGVAGTSFILLKHVKENVVSLQTDSVPGLVAICHIKANSSDIQRFTLRHVLAKSPDDKKVIDDKIAAASAASTEAFAAYDKTVFTDEERKEVDGIKALREKNKEARDVVLQLSRDGKTDEAIQYIVATQAKAYESYQNAVDDLVTTNESEAAVAAKSALTSAAMASTAIIGSSLFAIVLGIIIGTVIVRSLGRTLLQLASSLAEGAEQTVSAASQVSEASQSLAEGASEQAASLEETSSSLEEMASMTKRNAENANVASDLTKQTRAVADKGTADMRTMIAAMDGIKASGDETAKIIKTIDEIAFQTNILALNAAVEAARAGEAGMGFAVVADEVRNLAQRSAQAAKETAAKIEGAITKTAQGVELSGKVSEALNDIVTKARQVDELAAEVAGASREQTQGITQINVAVSEMDKVTQSNAASAEESAAAAEELNSQALTMKHSVVGLQELIGGNVQKAATKTKAAPRHAKAKEIYAIKHVAKHSAPVKSNGHARAITPMANGTKGRGEIPMDGDFKDF
jgi:methyl-accepting chemotaxis protein